jgi:hypothetical protein
MKHTSLIILSTALTACETAHGPLLVNQDGNQGGERVIYLILTF